MRCWKYSRPRLVDLCEDCQAGKYVATLGKGRKNWLWTGETGY